MDRRIRERKVREKTVKVMCTRGWYCGFYQGFSDAKHGAFLYCHLCGCFLVGRVSP